MEHCDPPELRLSQVEGFYISQISTKMRFASHIHGSIIPWNTLNFIFSFIKSYYVFRLKDAIKENRKEDFSNNFLIKYYVVCIQYVLK